MFPIHHHEASLRITYFSLHAERLSELANMDILDMRNAKDSDMKYVLIFIPDQASYRWLQLHNVADSGTAVTSLIKWIAPLKSMDSIVSV